MKVLSISNKWNASSTYEVMTIWLKRWSPSTFVAIIPIFHESVFDLEENYIEYYTTSMVIAQFTNEHSLLMIIIIL